MHRQKELRENPEVLMHDGLTLEGLNVGRYSVERDNSHISAAYLRQESVAPAITEKLLREEKRRQGRRCGCCLTM